MSGRRLLIVRFMVFTGVVTWLVMLQIIIGTWVYGEYTSSVVAALLRTAAAMYIERKLTNEMRTGGKTE